ncbi:thiol-disulfide oxidoreductase DCC family protein [Streptomyces albicerus]|jgi:predicted DCC family thiol-disulfide oxidoreductase YuxK|uniref:thiol-disulfide oxidoreductase DCC family protein n=1 Tax=Streptomyces albicerus TaxID=2569859 RepID=UPI00124B929B|nr:DCC1-like thiol-disulfide oxidoreductase family protein [Streptomyces albicerus]
MATAAAQDRDAARVPVRGLTVLYDAQCSLCAHLRDWLVRQRQLVPLELMPAGSETARRRFPGIDHAATLDEITVVGDSGQVYRGTAAWIVTLWALAEHRPMAHRLSTPAGARLARGAVLAAAKWREAQSARQQGRWRRGGNAYYGAHGWTYDPAAGWTYNAPACDSGTCAPR